jgi:hypothetical protein
MRRRGHTANGNEESVDLGRYKSFHRELVQFSPAENLSDADQQLVRDIVVLDHRSLHALGLYSESRAEVKALLQNAVTAAGYMLATGDGFAVPGPRHTDAAIGLYRQAEDIFIRHLQSKNRLWYLVGVAMGILILVLCAFGVRQLPEGLITLVKPQLIPALIFFAGLGSVVSLLLRLSALDLVKEISRPILVISGLGRPFVASAFALVVYLVLDSHLVTLSLSTQDERTYLVISFLCGFSERFAQDLLDRVQVGQQPAPIPPNARR